MEHAAAQRIERCPNIGQSKVGAAGRSCKDDRRLGAGGGRGKRGWVDGERMKDRTKRREGSRVEKRKRGIEDGKRERDDSRDSKVLVELCCGSELLYGSFVLAEGSVDEADVGEDLGGVGDLGEELQALFKVLCVIGLEGGSPCFELCLEGHGG